MPEALFEEIAIKDIPKTHRGKSNETYDKVLEAFSKAKAEAIKVRGTAFGEIKPTSIAHTFRMRIKAQKLKIAVQLDTSNNVVYLKKTK